MPFREAFLAALASNIFLITSSIIVSDLLWINIKPFNTIIYFSTLCLPNYNYFKYVTFRKCIVFFQIPDKHYEGRKNPNRAETAVTVKCVAT